MRRSAGLFAVLVLIGVLSPSRPAAAEAPAVIWGDELILDFGPQLVGSTSPIQGSYITNSGPTTATGITVGTPTSGAFHVASTTCGSTLAPGARCFVGITYAPTDALRRDGTVTVTASGGSTVAIALHGRADAPQIWTRVRRTSLDFGPIAVGAHSPVQNVTITNTSPYRLDIDIDRTTPTGPFSIVPGGCGDSPITLTGGASCTVSYRFDPTAAGPASGTAAITLTEPSTPARTFPVRLEGHGGSAGAYPLKVTPHGFDFGTIHFDRPDVAAETVHVTNVSSTARTIHLRGGEAEGFAFVDGCDGATLAPGTSCTLTYDVDTDQNGLHGEVGRLELAVAGFPVRRVDVPLTVWWQAYFPAPSFTRADRDLGPVAVGETSKALAFRLENQAGMKLLNIAVARDAPFEADTSLAISTAACAGGQLGPYGGCDIQVSYTPTDTSRKVFHLTLTADAEFGHPGPPEHFVRHVTVRAGPPTGVNEAFVQAAHADFLGRPPTAGELADQTAALDAGTISRRDSVHDLSTSAEWIGAIVTDLYQDTLGRGPDPGGLLHWTNAIRTGHLTVADVAARFYASAEYYRRAGSTDAAWVGDLYDQLLGRPADPGGLDYWVGQTATKGRRDVAARFYRSPESRRARVTGLYRALLGRAPDPKGLAHWSTKLLATGDLALALELASSNEYLVRAQARFP